VHDKSAKLIAVRRVPADRVTGRLGSPLTTPGDTDTLVCAFAFKGTFVAGQVTAAPVGAHGQYAVVLVTSRHLKVLAAFVVDRLPKMFGRTVV
jgi:hypothetical protein